MQKKLTRLAIPDDLAFEALKLTRDPRTGEVAICAASGVDVEVFKHGPEAEDNVSALIVAWYRAHLACGGAPDAVQEQILAEVAAEDVAVLVANPGAGGVH